jgi:hypothetical protein
MNLIGSQKLYLFLLEEPTKLRQEDARTKASKGTSRKGCKIFL